jgi:Na+-transporting methylmalonyl-CoA/oxaloacetate decarboxylase gamma subunit
MPFTDSVLVALFCMLVVFVVLGLLWVTIRIFSIAIIAFEKKINRTSKSPNVNS